MAKHCVAAILAVFSFLMGITLVLLCFWLDSALQNYADHPFADLAGSQSASEVVVRATVGSIFNAINHALVPYMLAILASYILGPASLILATVAFFLARGEPRPYRIRFATVATIVMAILAMTWLFEPHEYVSSGSTATLAPTKNGGAVYRAAKH